MPKTWDETIKVVKLALGVAILATYLYAGHQFIHDPTFFTGGQAALQCYVLGTHVTVCVSVK